MKLTEKQITIINYLKDNGGQANMLDICEATGIPVKSMNALVTNLGVAKDGSVSNRAKGLVSYKKVPVEGEEKPAKIVFLTDAGMAWTPEQNEEVAE